MKRLSLVFMVIVLASIGLLAQRNITGQVADEKGEPLIGANVLVKGTTVGTVTDLDGNYNIQVPSNATTLIVSYTGFTTSEVTLGSSNVVNVTLAEGITLEETVVTALGVSRYKNELPYSAQKVGAEEITATRDANVVNSLAGKVAGLDIKRNNSLGGSTNIVLRGVKSLTNDNQALFVVDGVPIDNTNNNTANQRTGRAGYDYGNAAADINPDDIESMTVLKGAAATALYGSRATNGVVMITTKKGRKEKGIGVTVNSGISMGVYDPNTFITYQNKYGAGYGAYYEDASGFFLERDINGDGTPDLVATTSEDASWGAKFDPSLMVYQWDAFDPKSPNFGKPKPWVAAKNNPNAFFENAFGTNNSIMVDGSLDKGYVKLGFTRATDKGILPNSQVNKNLVNFGASYQLSKKLTVGASVNYSGITGTGRYGTGYDAKNLMTNFRQWWQTNVDIKDQQDAYERDQKNITWNWTDPTILTPIYWDNPYWTRYQNFQNDARNRYYGYLTSTYNVNNWLDIIGRVSLDQYDEIQEERIAVGSVDVSSYSRFNRNFKEVNYDLMGQVKSINLTDKLKFDALIGSNVRRTEVSSIRASTNGGLSIPGLYSLSNSVSGLLAPSESFTQLQVNGIFGKVGFVYDRWVILDATLRRDQASSLPSANNSYWYPSASLGLLLSRFLNDNSVITHAKVRANYAEVSNTANPLLVNDVYNLSPVFDGVALANVATVKNFADLKPERTKSIELGLEMRFLKDAVGFDFSYYKTNTFDQIIAVAASRSTGYSSKVANVGEVQNQGVELSVFARPIVKKDFDWKINVNWARNRNLVVDLGNDIDNLQLGSFQGGVSINAAEGQPYGTIRGNNFVYNDKGQRVIGANGFPLRTATSNDIIGNVNPDWIGGIQNTLRYKNLSLGFLIDVRQGGDIFSLDLYYGLATGLYPETAVTNDLGNEARASLANGGGIIFDGVKADGSPNDKRVSLVNFGAYGYARNPAAAFVYDASFVKLREITLNYNLPASIFTNSRIFKGISISAYGRNLWIIHKNIPYADPEEGFSSGNIQGYQGGAYPTTRTFGMNFNFKF